MSTLIRQVRLVPVGSPAPTSEPVDVRVRDGMVADVVAGFARGALERGTAGDHPDIAYSWYVSGLLILAWHNAGWYGRDRLVLPRLGTPWHRGELFHRDHTQARTS
jgi:hypothetical protein